LCFFYIFKKGKQKKKDSKNKTKMQEQPRQQQQKRKESDYDSDAPFAQRRRTALFYQSYHRKNDADNVHDPHTNTASMFASALYKCTKDVVAYGALQKGKFDVASERIFCALLADENKALACLPQVTWVHVRPRHSKKDEVLFHTSDMLYLLHSNKVLHTIDMYMSKAEMAECFTVHGASLRQFGKYTFESLLQPSGSYKNQSQQPTSLVPWFTTTFPDLAARVTMDVFLANNMIRRKAEEEKAQFQSQGQAQRVVAIRSASPWAKARELDLEERSGVLKERRFHKSLANMIEHDARQQQPCFPALHAQMEESISTYEEHRYKYEPRLSCRKS
jgi:hypothetical protein